MDGETAIAALYPLVLVWKPMFLFLSKLLPLFIYPLGLTCLLLLIAFMTLRKRPRWARTAIVLAFAVLMLSGNNWVAEMMTKSL